MKLMKCLMMTKMHIQTLNRVINNSSLDKFDRIINLIEPIVSMKSSIDMQEEVEQSLVLDSALISQAITESSHCLIRMKITDRCQSIKKIIKIINISINDYFACSQFI